MKALEARASDLRPKPITSILFLRDLEDINKYGSYRFPPFDDFDEPQLSSCSNTLVWLPHPPAYGCHVHSPRRARGLPASGGCQPTESGARPEDQVRTRRANAAPLAGRTHDAINLDRHDFSSPRACGSI